MFDIFNIVVDILVLVFIYVTSNRYHRLVKLERLENTGISTKKYNAYDKRLRLECISFVVVIGIATILNQFVSMLIVALVMFILWFKFKVLIDKCSPIPK